MVSLHKKAGSDSIFKEVHAACRAEFDKPQADRVNQVKRLYKAFTAEEISAEVSNLVYPEGVSWKGEVEIIFQTIENLHDSIDGPCGDWYFTGDYPTAGGMSTVNAAYINWFEGKTGRGYELS
jgi:amidophosphoribosyltransferase